MGRHLRTSVVVGLFVVWVILAVASVLTLVVESRSDCPGFDSSGGGDPAVYRSWQWLPPGRQCVYVENGQVHGDDPSWARLVVVTGLVGWPVTVAALGVSAVTDRREEL